MSEETKEKDTKSSNKISLENFNYESKTQRLSSPLSITACKMNGVTESDIVFLSFEDYIRSHPESMNIPKELQQERYDNFEKNRNKLIEDLKTTRQNLMDAKENEEMDENKEKNEEEKDDDENCKTLSGFKIKNKENRKHYKKLKDNMELTIRVHIDREYETKKKKYKKFKKKFKR